MPLLHSPTHPAREPGSLPAEGSEGSLVRRLLAALIILAGFVVVGIVFSQALTPEKVAGRDYIEFWAQGQQLVRHANPYDVQAIWNLERQAGRLEKVPLVSFSPPIALPLTVPLGFVAAKPGLIAWLLIQLGCVALASWILWMLNGRPDSRWHLLGFVFPPVIACQMAGQLGNFFLLCLALFLYLHARRPFVAGMVLMPLALKPHLFLPVALVLLCWTLWRRNFAILLGFATALAASCAASLYIDPSAWHQYRQMLSQSGVLDQFVPALSVEVRFLIARQHTWVQFIPEVLACGWSVCYFWKHRRHWDWVDHGLLVLLVAAVCTPYGWYSDEPILFPAILAGLYRAFATGRSILPLVLIAGGALVETLSGVQMNTTWYLWTTPAWLGWYLFATWTPRANHTAPTTVLACSDSPR